MTDIKAVAKHFIEKWFPEKSPIEADTEMLDDLLTLIRLSAKAGICPHYYEATDGVHAVVVGQCKCKGKISVPPADGKE